MKIFKALLARVIHELVSSSDACERAGLPLAGWV